MAKDKTTTDEPKVETAEAAPTVQPNVKQTDEGTYTTDQAGVVVFTRS
jgi:hypothetical protein